MVKGLMAVVLGCLVGFASGPNAWAAWRRQSGFTCTLYDETTGVKVIMNQTYGMYGFLPSPAVTQYYFTCPLNDDSLFDRSTVNTLNVHVYETSPTETSYVTACAKYYGSAGAACGTASWTAVSGADWHTLTPGRSVWTTNTADFAYLFGQANVSNGVTAISGIFVAN